MKNINLKVNISPEGGAIFWGKNCADILKEEFKDYLQEFEGNGYIAEISSFFPLADLMTVYSLIKTMQDSQSIETACGGIKITNTQKKSEGGKKANDIKLLCADINKEKICINEILRQKIIEKHIENGVYITDPTSTYIDFDVQIESGVTIYHNNFITGKSVIKKNCMLMPNNSVNNTTICEKTVITASTFNEAYVGENTTVGPNAYLRPNAKVGANCKIGDFVEVKNAQIGNGTKVSHLAYVGDAIVGENCNIGCGVIFVNYNGKTKNKSIIGNNTFIGSNCNIIAPVNIGNKVFVAAGTTVTQDLKDSDFCIGRVRPEIKGDRGNRYID